MLFMNVKVLWLEVAGVIQTKLKFGIARIAKSRGNSKFRVTEVNDSRYQGYGMFCRLDNQ
jgi:hypothetical protein